ncbi:hypothetical protein R1sor_021022 [Riccia sorocarpa]|uniref:FCP1 homology domain-containing protein n=1 Tax=Riccia sorocarpa TaxID=122646 RepID=A0ABD3GHC0_9MARC
MSELDYSTANVADWRSTAYMQVQLSSVKSAVRERREEEERLKVQVFKMETYMRKVNEDPIGLSVRVLELRAERARLEEWLREQTLAKQDLEKAMRMQRPPLLPRRKTIVIDLNGLLMKVGRSREELAAAARNGYDILSTAKTWFVPRPGLGGFLKRCMEWFNVILCTFRQDRNMAVLLKKCDQMGFFPSELKKKANIPELTRTQLESGALHNIPDRQGAAQRRLSTMQKRTGAPKVAKAYRCTDGICTKDVIIIDDIVQKNSPNHSFQTVHPRPFDPFKTAKKDENYLGMVLHPFLDKFRGHKGDIISYVQANWQTAQAQDPIASLVGYWAPMDERDEDFLWSNCTAADRQKFLAELNGHRLKLSTQKAMQFAIADADQPSQTQDGTGPSNSSRTASTELGRPIFPAPLSAASLVSNAEILLAGCRDDDMELSRQHGDY